MRLKKIGCVLLVMVLTITCFAGCGGNGSEVSAREKRIEQDELIVTIGAEPETGFDATTGGHGSLTKVFFSTLFKRDKQLGWENDLATGYTVSPDKLTWTVTLRKDALFTDGTPVTAEDVAFTYSTAKESGSEIDLTMLESVKAVDDYTVEFKLKRTFSPFIERMAYLGIIPKHAYDENFKDNPMNVR